MPIPDKKKREYVSTIGQVAGRLETHAAYTNPFPVETYTLYRTLLPDDDVRMFENIQPRYSNVVLGSEYLPIKLDKKWQFFNVPMLLPDNEHYLQASVKLMLRVKTGQPRLMTGLKDWHKPWKDSIQGGYAAELLHVVDSNNEYYAAIEPWALNVVQHTLGRLIAISAAEQLFKECQTEAQIRAIWPNALRVLGWGLMAKVGTSKGRTGHIPRALKERLAKTLPLIDEYLARASLLPPHSSSENNQVVHVVVSRAIHKRSQNDYSFV